MFVYLGNALSNMRKSIQVNILNFKSENYLCNQRNTAYNVQTKLPIGESIRLHVQYVPYSITSRPWYVLVTRDSEDRSAFAFYLFVCHIQYTDRG
jgi:hypothetical protein